MSSLLPASGTRVGVNRSIRVAIADRHENFRVACKRILELESDIEMVSESSTGFGLLSAARFDESGRVALRRKDLGSRRTGVVQVRSGNSFQILRFFTWFLLKIGQEPRGHAVGEWCYREGRNTAHLPKAIRKIVDGELWMSQMSPALMQAGLERG
jgi:hypothetical protein